MRLYTAQVPAMSAEIVRVLCDSNDIETEARPQVEDDVASVLRAYLQAEREILEKAKDLLQSRNLRHEDLGRMKSLVAEQKGVKIGDEMLDYLLDQIVEMLMHSANVDEVYAQDVELRRKMSPIIKRHLSVDEQIDQETRAHIKQFEEGTRAWEIEYKRVAEEVKRRKGL